MIRRRRGNGKINQIKRKKSKREKLFDLRKMLSRDQGLKEGRKERGKKKGKEEEEKV